MLMTWIVAAIILLPICSVVLITVVELARFIYILMCALCDFVCFAVYTYVRAAKKHEPEDDDLLAQ